MPVYSKQAQRDKVRRKIRAATDPENYSYTPGREGDDRLKIDEHQRVGIYARVSTEDPSQTSSFELQQKYYMEMVSKQPKWELVKIYSDEGISGTTMTPRKGLKEMLDDAYNGKLDLIIVKNISRLNRNIEDFLKTIKKLRGKKVGVFFESEGLYSLDTNNMMMLTTLANMAEQESRARSRSMETSLRMRLDHGLPLTPELLGFKKDADGKLVVNPETKNIPITIFFSYIFGYSTELIATKLIALSKKTYRGNISWTAHGIGKILRNERYCGDVLTRKRFKFFPPDVGEGQPKTQKNYGEKPQSYYKNEHESIISRDDFLAVQRIMDNAKYGGTSRLPDLKVIPDGLLKGFVIVHPKWGSFTKDDYINACMSVDGESLEEISEITAEAGTFDLRGYEVADLKLFDDRQVTAVSLGNNDIRFSTSCIRNMSCGDYVELLVHPIKKKLAVRPVSKKSKYAVKWSDPTGNTSRSVACKAFIGTIFDIFEWEIDFRYKLYGCIYRDGNNSACVFSDLNASVLIRKDDYLSSAGIDAEGQLLNQSGRFVRAFSNDSGQGFQNYYSDKSLYEIPDLTREQWQTQIDGIACLTKEKLNITPYEEIRAFLIEELGELFEEVVK